MSLLIATVIRSRTCLLSALYLPYISPTSQPWSDSLPVSYLDASAASGRRIITVTWFILDPSNPGLGSITWASWSVACIATNDCPKPRILTWPAGTGLGAGGGVLMGVLRSHVRF